MHRKILSSKATESKADILELLKAEHLLQIELIRRGHHVLLSEGNDPQDKPHCVTLHRVT